MHVWFIWYSKSGDSIGSLLSTSKRTKDDCLLGGGSVRVDKVNGGIDRGVSRLGKNAIHLDSLFLNEQKTAQTGRAVKHRRSCFQREADRDRRKSGGGGDDDEESRQARRKHFQRGVASRASSSSCVCDAQVDDVDPSSGGLRADAFELSISA